MRTVSKLQKNKSALVGFVLSFSGAVLVIGANSAVANAPSCGGEHSHVYYTGNTRVSDFSSVRIQGQGWTAYNRGTASYYNNSPYPNPYYPEYYSECTV